jgi:putative NADH-flavin reductase
MSGQQGTRIAVLGASGRTGRLVVERALDRGLAVVAPLRRQPAGPLDDRVSTAVIGLTDPVALARVVEGAEAVVDTIGPIAGETTTEVSGAVGAVLEAMERTGIRRIVAAANAKVFTDDEVTGEYANVTTEHRRVVALLRASSRDWTVLAAPFLKDDPPTGEVETAVDAKGPGRSLTRGDFATTLLDAIDRSEWIGHIVGVTNR